MIVDHGSMGEPGVPRRLATAAAVSWRVLVVAAAVAIVTLTLVELRLIVVPAIAAVLLATFLRPPVRWLTRRRWPDAVATLVVMATTLALVAGVLAVVAPSVAGQLDELDVGVRAGAEEVVAFLVEGPLGVSEQQIDRSLDRARNALRANSGLITSGVLSGALVVAEAVAGVLLTAAILFFFLKDGEGIWRWLVQRLPPARRARLHRAG